jgi:hypothetical protein
VTSLHLTLACLALLALGVALLVYANRRHRSIADEIGAHGQGMALAEHYGQQAAKIADRATRQGRLMTDLEWEAYDQLLGERAAVLERIRGRSV